MANYELKFLDLSEDDKKIEVFKNEKKVLGIKDDFVRIVIESPTVKMTYFDMDKSTAIKFAKTLRTEINKITEREVNNG